MTAGSRADVGGVVLDYEERGDRARPTVLLIMGLAGQRILWPPELLDGLVARGCHVVTFDNRDVGRSSVLDRPPGAAGAGATPGEQAAAPPYTLADMADDALGLLDHLGVGRAHLVGASMGGMIAQHLAFTDPRRVTSLVLLASTGDSLPADESVRGGTAALFDPPPRERDAFIEHFVAGCRQLASPTLFDEAGTRELAAGVYARGVHPEGAERQLRAVLADGSRMERLASVSAPTLVIHGAADPLLDVASAQATADAIPEAALVVLEEMGHDLPLALVPHLVDVVAAHVARAEAGLSRPGTSGRGTGRDGDR